VTSQGLSPSNEFDLFAENDKNLLERLTEAGPIEINDFWFAIIPRAPVYSTSTSTLRLPPSSFTPTCDVESLKFITFLTSRIHSAWREHSCQAFGHRGSLTKDRMVDLSASLKNTMRSELCEKTTAKMQTSSTSTGQDAVLESVIVTILSHQSNQNCTASKHIKVPAEKLHNDIRSFWPRRSRG
jgi:hypothetical protein